jgi:Zn-dependent oligopeptidase
LLTSTNFTDTSDQNSVEIDAANLNNQLFERFVYVPEVINMISANVNTGEALPVDTLNLLKSQNSNLNAFNLMKKAMLSAFDIECHIRQLYKSTLFA